jgi:hypothetical protein
MMGGWLAQLKNHASSSIHPREPRQPPEVDSQEGSLGYQACRPAPFQKFMPATVESASDSVPSVAAPDRCCWPYSMAMNAREIDTFMARVARFIDRGLKIEEAERLADAMIQHDRDIGNDMRYCMECAHLQGAAVWRCGNFRQAEIGPDLPKDLVFMGQRCSGFALIPIEHAEETH